MKHFQCILGRSKLSVIEVLVKNRILDLVKGDMRFLAGIF